MGVLIPKMRWMMAVRNLQHKNNVLGEEGNEEMANGYEFEIKVRERAYQLWEQAHKPPGGQYQHFWHEAEQQLKEEQDKEDEAKQDQAPKQ